ncbi:NADH-quinone oxidoreductase subunit J family protein [Reichenbachiella versicolor]|uniref:NADH-quinone oxidoreductase subunit J family protein n=1 Tax=Reichenbachiella versicolor TaxID=1821036 RepID=UPI000D6E0DC6|nr:NADH-quinone oxidoreductase subunit J [Reichenbachiella versicolor]
MGNIDFNILAFYFFAGMSVFGALMILFTKNIVHAIFMLVLVFFGVAAIYIVSNAEFVGITQILVYIGGLLILMTFGLMLSQRVDGSKLLSGNKLIIPAVLLTGALGMIFYRLFQAPFPLFSASVKKSAFTITETIGIKLMSDHLLMLELTAVFLLMALVGAAYIAGRGLKKQKR